LAIENKPHKKESSKKEIQAIEEDNNLTFSPSKHGLNVVNEDEALGEESKQMQYIYFNRTKRDEED